MKVFFTIIGLLLSSFFALSQNLVPNPSFEQSSRKPAAMLDEGMEFTRAVPGWSSPTRASTDFITSRFRASKIEKIPAHSGENMVGSVVQGDYWAEYIAAKLFEPLEVGKKYYVEFWISAPSYYNKKKTGTPLLNDHFGLLFDDHMYFKNTKIISKRPQIVAQPDTRLIPREWIKINGSFTAKQSATHLYIGQFLDEKNPTSIIEGYFYIDDIFVEKLEKDAEQFEPSKTYQIKGKVASITMENIYFETDKYDLLPESFQELNKLVNIMKNNTSMTINIKGHTDSEGDEKHNQSLSENRANSVHDYLVQQGIKKERLSHEGRGMSQPIAENKTVKGRQKNRRVEFVTKSQDTVGQGVILSDVAYLFSKNIANDAAKLMNIGKDERSWNCANLNFPTTEITPAYKKLVSSFSQYKPQTARNFILEKTKEAQVVHLQTSSVFPAQQQFILELLDDLYEQGFRYIGLEDIKKIAQLSELGYPTYANGQVFQQPIYGELIRQAQRLGFNIFSLQPSKSELAKVMNILKKQRVNFPNESEEETAKNWASAMNINRILKKTPNAKVLLLTGDVEEVKDGSQPLAAWLKKFTKIDILSIGQSPTHVPCLPQQEPLLQKMKISRPSVFLKRSIMLLPLRYDQNGEVIESHDIEVYHPKNTFPNNRPKYLLANDQRRPYQLNIDKFKMKYPCLVFAYKKGEDINKAIPVDVIELTDNQDVTPLILGSGTYEIVLRDGGKRKKMEVVVE